MGLNFASLDCERLGNINQANKRSMWHIGLQPNQDHLALHGRKALDIEYLGWNTYLFGLLTWLAIIDHPNLAY